MSGTVENWREAAKTALHERRFARNSRGDLFEFVQGWRPVSRADLTALAWRGMGDGSTRSERGEFAAYIKAAAEIRDDLPFVPSKRLLSRNRRP